MKTIAVTVLGTANSTPVFLDPMVNPFQVSVATNLNTGNATWNVQHTFDQSTAYLPTWDGSTGVTWYNNTGITAATASISGNYAFPVIAVRLNVTNAANATTSVTMLLTQADTVPP